MASPTEVAAEIVEDLREGLEEVVPRRGGGRALLSATRAIEPVDPCAVAFGARLASEAWYAWAEPDRGFALGAIGAAYEATSRGRDRFTDVNADCLRLLRDRVWLRPPDSLPAGAGPLFTGGFAFAPEGGSAPNWSSFAPAAMTLPEISVARQGEETFLTVNVVAGAGRDPRGVASRLEGRLASLVAQALPMADPS